MLNLRRQHDQPEPEALVVPDGYVLWPPSKQEAAVPPLVDLATRGSRLLDGRAQTWAVSPDGRLLGPPSLVNSGRPDREHQLTADEFFVFDVGRPADGDLEGHIRRQVRGCYFRPRADAPATCWQVGMPFPDPDPVVEVARPEPPKPLVGLHLGRPVDARARTMLRLQAGDAFRRASEHATVRWENPDPDGKLLPSEPPGPRWADVSANRPGIEAAFDPCSGVLVGTTMTPETNERRNFLIIWPSHLELGDADIDRIRVDGDGRVWWCVWPGEPDRPFVNANRVRCVRVES